MHPARFVATSYSRFPIRAIIAPSFFCTDGIVLILLKTWFEMITLRRGPDAVPASWLVLLVAVGILGIGWLIQVGLAENADPRNLSISFIAYLLTLAFFGAIVYLYGYADRLLQTLSSIIACGSIVALAAALIAELLTPLVGSAEAFAVGYLMWLWSVPVKGHIVARAIQQHWFVGFAFALSAYLLWDGIQVAFVNQA